ncbi:unnamed protein product [Protopolystoma xenopodis]|uniref:Uncharacterized protein n=1 Tax=Protopolystoma xenopodis TaxID=117903 RepID=A0A448X4X2_9PLAT|nr:unnamed protein product [Protopolystoma xenopodis]
MIALTGIISLCLIVAIFCVRRRPLAASVVNGVLGHRDLRRGGRGRDGIRQNGASGNGHLSSGLGGPGRPCTGGYLGNGVGHEGLLPPVYGVLTSVPPSLATCLDSTGGLGLGLDANGYGHHQPLLDGSGHSQILSLSQAGTLGGKLASGFLQASKLDADATGQFYISHVADSTG